MKALLLARVSSKEQEENNSIPSQLRRLRDYASRSGFDDTEPFKLVESSTKSTRKEFSKIVEKINHSSQKVALICDTVDRLQRSFKESVLLDELRKDGKVELHFVREGLIINDGSNSADILRWDMGVMFAKSYVTQLSDNVKRGLEQKRLNGEWSNRAPFGYRNIDLPDGKKSIEPDDNALIVRDIFEWYATASYSMRQLRDRLKAEHGLNLATSQIEKILKRKFYYGVMHIKGVEYRHHYQSLISRNLYESVQAVKVGFNKQNFKYAGLPYFYRGLITCGTCGCAITPEKSKGHVYYHCTQYKGKHGAAYVREEELTSQLVEAFRSIQPTREQFADVMAALKASNADKVKYRTQHEKTLQGELTKVEARKNRLFDAFLDDMVEKTEYEKKVIELRESKLDIETRLSTLDKVNDEFYSTLENLMRIARNAPLTLESSKLEQRKELINLVLQNLELDDRQLRWKYKKPFDLMASCAKMNSWLGRSVKLRTSPPLFS